MDLSLATQINTYTIHALLLKKKKKKKEGTGLFPKCLLITFIHSPLNSMKKKLFQNPLKAVTCFVDFVFSQHLQMKTPSTPVHNSYLPLNFILMGLFYFLY